MKHLKEIIRMFSPKMIIFNHDWAAPQGICKNYGPRETLDRIANVTQIFSRFYPSRTPFGRSWNFLIQAGEGEGQEDDNQNMTWGLYHQAGIPSFVVETYFCEDTSNRLHLQVGLFLLAKFANASHDDKDLVKLVAA
jgi:hypothetical protein